MRKVLSKNLLPFGILFIISIPAILPFLHAGFPKTDDANWMIIRLSAFYEAIRDGQIPVRWLGRLNNGYGYPVSNFLYPGFLYLGTPLAILTSFVTAVKLLFIGSLLGSSFGTFLWLKNRFSVLASLVGAIVYLYAPYHLYDATVRGSLGEVLFLGLLPFVFWAIDRKSTFLLPMLLGLLLISHNTLAVLFLPILLIYNFIVTRSDQVEFKKKWMGIGTGIALSAFFWIPALGDLSSTVFSSVKVSDWSNYFADISLIGLGGVGVLLIAGGLYFTKRKSTTNSILVLVFGLISLLSLLLSTHLSAIVWEHAPVAFIQFPFRFLSIFLIGIAFISAWIVALHKRFSFLMSLIIVSCIYISGMKYLTVSSYEYYDEGYYTTNMDTTTVKNEYMPKWVKEQPAHYSEKKVIGDNVAITSLVAKSNTISFETSASMSSQVIVQQVFFPGWKARIDNKPMVISHENSKGLMTLSIPAGEHRIKLFFTETPLRLVADAISIVSLAFCFIYALQSRRSKK